MSHPKINTEVKGLKAGEPLITPGRPVRGQSLPGMLAMAGIRPTGDLAPNKDGVFGGRKEG